MPYWMIKVNNTLTNYIVSFEQLVPEKSFLKGVILETNENIHRKYRNYEVLICFEPDYLQ